MKLNVLCRGEGDFSGQSPHIPPNPSFPNAPTASLIRHQRSLSEMKPVPGIEEVMPWGVFAAYAAALASTGFLFVMTLTRGINLG